MKLVIDIPNNLYKDIKESYSITLGTIYTDKVVKAIKNGTQLQKGQWVKETLTDGKAECVRCSNCGCGLYYFKEFYSNYCPNCGAEMEV